MPVSARPLVIFSHGNSFPASTYDVMLQSLKSRGFQIKAIEKIGHDPRYPVSSNWPHLVQELADFASGEIEKTRKPAFLVGHSLGGFLSLMCAARHPVLGGQPLRGVVMLDSPVLGGWRATALNVAKRTQMVGALTPGAISRKRRQQWPSAGDALVHFRGKKAFSRWDEQVLRDYIAHGTRAADSATPSQRVLCFDRDIETAIYNTLPDNLERLLARHPLKCPAAFIGGRHSAEVKQIGMAMTEKVTHGRVMMLDGSHLFPMEQPIATAAALEAALLNLAMVKSER